MAYSGIFVRQVLGQTPNDQSDGSCECPDVILNGTSAVPDPSVFATQADYAISHPPDVYISAPPGTQNYVYLRGLQANGYTQGTNFFFYYVESDLALWPQSWKSAQVTVGTAGGNDQNWAYAPATPNNQIVVNEQPLIWTPPYIDTNVLHYCVITWADNSTKANPIPPDLATFRQFGSFEELMYFLSQNPNMGWRNTTDHLVPPPDLTYYVNFTTKAIPETVTITIYFSGITDGTFVANLTGDVTATTGTTPLDVPKNSGFGYQFRDLKYPANAKTRLGVTYNKGTNPISPNARIHAQAQYTVLASHMEKLESLVKTPGYSLPIKRMRMVNADGSPGDMQNIFVLGQQTWNLKFS